MKIIPIFLLGFPLMVYDICYSQDKYGPNSKHERWEYILEDTGDVLQITLSVSAGIITLIKKGLSRDQKNGTSLYHYLSNNLFFKIFDQ